MSNKLKREVQNELEIIKRVDADIQEWSKQDAEVILEIPIGEFMSWLKA